MKFGQKCKDEQTSCLLGPRIESQDYFLNYKVGVPLHPFLYVLEAGPAKKHWFAARVDAIALLLPQTLPCPQICTKISTSPMKMQPIRSRSSA
eukprot:355137-Rhodomonas_salina.2